MLNEQFTPFIISPSFEQSQVYYWLENGHESLRAEMTDKIHFRCDEACLALVDYEVLDQRVLITEVHLVATNVDKPKLLSWIQAMQLDLVGYLVILISLITKVNDNALRAGLLEIIFHEELHPKYAFKDDGEKINNLYPSLIVSGQKAFLKCQNYTCTQLIRDRVLVKCLLKRLAKNELIANSSKYSPVKKLINEKLVSLEM